MHALTFTTTAAVALIATTSGYAIDYLTVEQAQAALLPGRTLQASTLKLTPEQAKSVEKTSRARLRTREIRTWRADDGASFFVDEVLGKHEYITYAVALDSAGAVLGVEVLSYRESYGGEVRRPAWRAQFTGKTALAPLKLDEDIKNIAGATLSSRHLAEGVKRILAVHDLLLASNAR
ncbi:MAG: FMN-binding protein [Burkholderiales bacterium]|nr:FMN-binding protein [Opitutaceae bacterium]